MLDLWINLGQDLCIRVVQHLVVIEKRLKLKETKFLNTLWSLGRKASANNLNC